MFNGKNGRNKALVFLVSVSACCYLMAMQWRIVCLTWTDFDARVVSSQDEHNMPHDENSHTRSIPLKNPIPRDLSIVFMGDSISRFQYTSLVYFLRHGEWYDPSNLELSIVAPPGFKTNDDGSDEDYWSKYFRKTNELLQPYEVCDCHRNFPGPVKTNETVINRHYYDPILNNAITYIGCFGHASMMKGRIFPRATLKGRKNTSTTPLNSPDLSFYWIYRKWSAVIRFYVSRLNPSPNHLILNAGWWDNNFLKDPKLAEDIRDAVAENNLTNTTYWRTTTSGKASFFNINVPKTDAWMCQSLARCWNVSWTRDIHHDWYWDGLHFYEPVYRAMNEELLEEIGALPDGYRRMDKKIVFSARSVAPF